MFTILLFIFLTTIRGVEPQSCNPAVVSYVVRNEKGSVLNETELQALYAQLPKKIQVFRTGIAPASYNKATSRLPIYGSLPSRS